MPFYDFKCEQCEYETCNLMSISAYEEQKENPVTCPECCEGTLQRLFTGTYSIATQSWDGAKRRLK